MCKKSILRGINTSYFLFQITVNKKLGKQNRKKVWNLQKAFSLRTIKTRLQISSEGTCRVCGRSLTPASMCFLYMFCWNQQSTHTSRKITMEHRDNGKCRRVSGQTLQNVRKCPESKCTHCD